MKSNICLFFSLVWIAGCNTHENAIKKAVNHAVSFDVSPRIIKQTYLQMSSCSSETALVLLKDSLGTNSLSFFLLTTASESMVGFQCHITPESILPILRLGNGKPLVMLRDITSLTMQKVQEGYEGSFVFNVKNRNEFFGKCLFFVKESNRGLVITKLAIAHNTLLGIENGLLVFDLSN